MNPGLQAPEPPYDAWADVFNLELNPYGVVITYGRREPPDFVSKPAEQRPIKTTARIAITPEHLKHMIYLMWRQTVQFEAAHGAINVPTALLEGVDMAEWNALYQVPPEPETPAPPDNSTGIDQEAIKTAVAQALANQGAEARATLLGEAGKNEDRPMDAEPEKAAASD